MPMAIGGDTMHDHWPSEFGTPGVDPIRGGSQANLECDSHRRQPVHDCSRLIATTAAIKVTPARAAHGNQEIINTVTPSRNVGLTEAISAVPESEPSRRRTLTL